MIGFKSFCFGFFFSFLFESCISDMEITNCIKSTKNVDVFISKNYLNVGSSDKNPIFPYKINYRSKNTKLTFCDIPIVESWVYKSGDFHTLFMLVKSDQNLIKSISDVYGSHEIESKVEINEDFGFPTTYYWYGKDINIIAQKFFNVWQIAGYNNCSLIIVGNMEYKDIVHLPNQ